MSVLQEPAMKTYKNSEPDYYLGPVAIMVTDSDTGSWRVETPVCDNNLCSSCGICAKFCPSNVIEVEKGKILGIDMRFCKGCGICSQVCPSKSIKMVENSKAVDI